MLKIGCNSCGAQYTVHVEDDPQEEVPSGGEGTYCIFCSSFINDENNQYEGSC